MNTQYENMSAAELLAEKSHMEQVIAMKLAEETRTQNATLNPDAYDREENDKQFQQELLEKAEKLTEELKTRREVIVYNKRNDRHIKGANRFGHCLAEHLTLNHWVMIDSFMRGYDYIRVFEKVNTISETKAFMVINGKRVKKGTHRITYIG